MAFSNPTHLYYPDPTTIPTFSPFYSSTIPPTYPTTIPNLTPTPTPNPSFHSYPHHLHDPSYHPPPSFIYPPYSSYPNSTASPSPNHYTSYTTSSPSDYAYSNHYNSYQHTNLSPPIITHNTTNTLQQQANTIQQPFYHHQPPNTSTPIYHHVDLPSHQNQNPTPTLPPSRLETKLSNFDGSEDAYWWIICSEKFFNNRNHSLSDAEKIIESILALRGAALTWWFSRFPTHRRPCWDSFTCGLLR
ncbi:soluble scavenger receptor cysteine-rich domain-containing protein SSC5D-like [Trifolium pratense]|uniref:soluble scavenger receptor cysteine-rich domain-containing protein SSC5D-like n=1 Tax=Trifolium pratense TaxID=57577 RepID=UPI001E6947D1|nr:soluble scavenger receptor cysteine-rich domain-containing protein SSC5D-like [Trifolium pratense]